MFSAMQSNVGVGQGIEARRQISVVDSFENLKAPKEVDGRSRSSLGPNISNESETWNELSQSTSPVGKTAHFWENGTSTESETSNKSSQTTSSVEATSDNGSGGTSTESETSNKSSQTKSSVEATSYDGSGENSFEGDIRGHNDQGSFNVISKMTEENKRCLRRIGQLGKNDVSVATLLLDLLIASYQLSIRRLPLPSSTISEDVPLHNGRYKKDFLDLELIGEGGFGEVKKVCHTHDKQHYAVKIVKFKSSSITWEKFSQEVTILAKLTNTHSHRIVRYHTAWLEEKDFSEPDTTESDDRGSHSSKPLTKYVLYIQMELCSKTLLKWLEDRNKKSQKDCKDPFNCVNCTTNIQILKQILEGISFLHEKGIWHRDLKPANVFLTEPQLEVKIGDFGLATCQEEENVEAVNPRPVASIFALPPAPTGRQLTTNIGTYPYIAPEQQLGSVYDSKADMYSFGIIKYEMFLPYKSLTETYESIEVLRKDGVIQEELKSQWPEEAKLIESLTNKDKMLRPSASDVLKCVAYSDHNQQTQLSQRYSLITEWDKELEKVKEERDKVKEERDKVKEEGDKELEKVKEERDQQRRENEKKEKIIQGLEEQLKALQ